MVIGLNCAAKEGDAAQRRDSARLPARHARGAQRAAPGLARWAVIESDNDLFDEAMRRAVADLVMLTTETPDGPYPYAGIPWFSTAFGRDAIITGLKPYGSHRRCPVACCFTWRQIRQRGSDRAADAEPGKILHEVRHGEMALLGEVPFRHYYGSVDATPLFVMLAGAYYERTGDIATLRTLWPHILAALDWIDRYGDADGDGFVEYGRKEVTGLINQGWKDSVTRFFTPMAPSRRDRSPCAKCRPTSSVPNRLPPSLRRRLAKARAPQALAGEAAALQARFESVFWDETTASMFWHSTVKKSHAA